MPAPSIPTGTADTLPARLWRLRDGRTLEWLECGDPAGYPLLFFHGFLGSIRQAYIGDGIAKREGIRIIAVNRPGTGRSTPHLYGSMIDHARDALTLAASLGIHEAASCGFSNGAGFALACAAAAPERIRFTAICSPLGPLSQPPFFRRLHWIRKLMTFGARHTPDLIRHVLGFIRMLTLYYPDTFLPFLNNAAHLSVDPAVRRNDALIRATSGAILDALIPPDSARSLTHEISLCYRWGFDPRVIRQRVYLWHGTEDDVSDPASAGALAALLSDVRAEYLHGDHVLILSVLPAIMHAIAREFAGLPVGMSGSSAEEREEPSALVPGLAGARY